MINYERQFKPLNEYDTSFGVESLAGVSIENAISYLQAFKEKMQAKYPGCQIKAEYDWDNSIKFDVFVEENDYEYQSRIDRQEAAHKAELENKEKKVIKKVDSEVKDEEAKRAILDLLASYPELKDIIKC